MNLRHLPNQQANEHVEAFLRRHWIEIVQIVAFFFLAVSIPVCALFVFWSDVGPYIDHPIIGPVLVMAGSFYYLAIWLVFLFEYTDYYLDTWIVTNERIINIEQLGLFKRVASELHLVSIQDATSEVKGILHTFLDYGDVHIQTAAEKSRFVFKDVSHPEAMKNLILRLVELDKKHHGSEVASPHPIDRDPPVKVM